MTDTVMVTVFHPSREDITLLADLLNKRNEPFDGFDQEVESTIYILTQGTNDLKATMDQTEATDLPTLTISDESIDRILEAFRQLSGESLFKDCSFVHYMAHQVGPDRFSH